MLEEAGDDFSEQSMRRMAQRLDGMLGRSSSEPSRSVRVPQKRDTTPFIDQHFLGREDIVSARQRSPAALSALVEKLEQLPEAEVSVESTERGYTVTCTAPGSDPSELELSVDANTLMIVGHTTVVMDHEGDKELEINWQLPVELPPDADLSDGSTLSVTYADEAAIIEVPKRCAAHSLSEAELQGLSVKELKRRLAELGVAVEHVVEKRELRDLLRRALSAQDD